jgi:hypothetical protein
VTTISGESAALVAKAATSTVPVVLSLVAIRLNRKSPESHAFHATWKVAIILS